ncbi:DNA repair protein rad50 [Malassezia brasiliensis]|uniref:DNA repair protein RAD50 n=1 Tax=Malassezia brasiliensis TaxID=1821822 RepID=A0AAF0DTZ9_9BASI|nr:DNA repair protein rad50 [Malassezia brasiliensis]
MAELDKLAIRGVRSFDPKAVHIIQFFKPLTVIVGHNGSGKTVRAPLTQTIVECLKYAATGDLPPNTKGGAFVHDPALAGTDTVKAQVRLRFRNTHGVRMSCVRNVQVSRKRTGALTLKTLEGVLGVDDDTVDAQTRAAISTRCAELDQEMAHLLGVSRAILEHVVFCHQEESHWPLAEPAVLKKRFDEIFEVTRYTKALDALKALRKQRQQDARVDDAELRALQHDKERAEAVQRTLDTLDASIAQKTRDVEALEADLAARTAANDALRDAAAQFREVLARAATLEERRALYADSAAELRRTAPLLDAPVAELEARLAALPATLAAAAAERDAAHARLADAQRARADADAAHEALVRQQGAHAAAQQTLARLRRDAHAELVEIAARHGLDAPAGDTEALAAATLAALRAHARTADAADDHAADDARARLDALEQDVQQRRSALRDVQAQHTHAAAALARLDARVAQADADLGAAGAPPVLDALRTRRDALAAQVRDADAAQARADADAQCRTLEARRDSLSRTLAASAHAVAARAALAEREQQHAARAAELAACTAALATDAARLATDGTPAGIAAAAAAALADAERAEAEADAAAASAAAAAARAAAALDVHDTQAAERDAQCAALRAADTYDGDLAHDLRAARDEVQLRDESLATLEHAAAFFARILAQGRERHVCLACDRALPDAALPAFEAHVRASMQRSTPERVAAVRAERDAWLAHVDALERAQRARDAAAEADAARAAHDARRAALAADAERTADARAAAQAAADAAHADADALRALAARAQAARTRAAEVASSDAALAAARTDLGEAPAAGDARGARRAVLRELAEGTAHRDALHRAHGEARDALADAERALHDAEARDAAARAARARRAEHARDADEARAAVDRLAAACDAAQAPLADAEHARDAAAAAARTAADAAAAARQERHRDAARAADLGASLRAAAADVPGDGAALDAALAEAQARRAASDAGVAAAERAAHTHAEAVRGAQATEAQLRDSVRCAQLERDAARAEAELRALDVAGARAQRDAYDARYDAARRAETAQRGEAAHLRGELRGLADERARRAAELATDYAGVHARYVKQLVHIKVARLADADLETYCGALHQAILQYHAIKMEEVNQTLDYLWKKTYQGTDIDTVLVRSDAEGRVGASGLRSYQYRVCMVKDRVELDMRGRCSAGQKVLACILVRLALADAFAAHCGFLALDEPTTNLDRENVEALAASLVDLIAERRHQRNFQLVVITHDEDFLTRLAQSDALTQYWRVSRDAHLHSVLERAAVRRV